EQKRPGQIQVLIKAPIAVLLSSEILHSDGQNTTTMSPPSEGMFVRTHDVAATIAGMGINNPAPAVSRHCAAIAPCPTGGAELAAHDLPVFHWRHDAG